MFTTLLFVDTFKAFYIYNIKDIVALKVEVLFK